MSLRINTNIDALTAYRNLTSTQNSMSTSIERLSSGLRINKAADDAAGLAISQGLTSQINGIGQAVRNAQDGINVVQTADGALNETQSILQRMRTLAVQSANDSNNGASRTDIQTEVTQLNSELDRIAGSTSFNGVNLLDGSFNNKQFQIGANNVAANDQIDVTISSAAAVGASTTFAAVAAGSSNLTTAGGLSFKYGNTQVDVDLTSLGTTSSNTQIAAALNGNASWSQAFTATVDDAGAMKISAKTFDGTAADKITITGGTVAGAAAGGVLAAGVQSGGTAAATGSAAGFSSTALGVNGVNLGISAATSSAAITTIDAAITSVSTARANLGAYQNRFQHTINNLSVTQENLQASNSSITDTDMAAEMSNYTRTQILSQAGTSMLKQANQASQSVLSLLQ